MFHIWVQNLRSGPVFSWWNQCERGAGLSRYPSLLTVLCNGWGGSHGSWPLSPLTESRPRFAKPARMMCSAPGSDSWTPRVRPASGRGRKFLGALKAARETVGWVERHRKKGLIYINCNATSWYSLMINLKDMLSQHQTRCHGGMSNIWRHCLIFWRVKIHYNLH